MSELAERMHADALEAQKFTRKHLVVELDFSVHSLGELDSQFDAVEYAIRGGKSAENLRLLTRIWGAYLGEVVRRHCGGEWLEEKGNAGSRIALRLPHETTYPHEHVQRRLTAGAEHDIRVFFEKLRRQAQPANGSQ
jgi:hypothetical protein